MELRFGCGILAVLLAMPACAGTPVKATLPSAAALAAAAVARCGTDVETLEVRLSREARGPYVFDFLSGTKMRGGGGRVEVSADGTQVTRMECWQ